MAAERRQHGLLVDGTLGLTRHRSAGVVEPQHRVRAGANHRVGQAAGLGQEVIGVDEDAAVVRGDEARPGRGQLDGADGAAVLIVGDQRGGAGSRHGRGAEDGQRIDGCGRAVEDVAGEDVNGHADRRAVVPVAENIEKHRDPGARHAHLAHDPGLRHRLDAVPVWVVDRPVHPAVRQLVVPVPRLDPDRLAVPGGAAHHGNRRALTPAGGEHLRSRVQRSDQRTVDAAPLRHPLDFLRQLGRERGDAVDRLPAQLFDGTAVEARGGLEQAEVDVGVGGDPVGLGLPQGVAALTGGRLG